MVGITSPKVPRRVGVRPVRVLKRAGARMTKVTTTAAVRTARVLKKLERVIKRKDKEREQRAASYVASSAKPRLVSDLPASADPELEEEEKELNFVEEMLGLPEVEPPSRPPSTHRSSIPSHSDSNPKPRLVTYSPRSSGDPEEEEFDLVSEILKSPSPTHVDTESPPPSPPRSNRSSFLSDLPRQLSPPLTRSTAPVQERSTAPPPPQSAKSRSPAEIQTMRRRYYLLQIRRYRSRPVVPIDPATPVEDIHLGFQPPSPEDEKYLDITTTLTLFNIMMKLGRKDGLDVVGDAFVFRNYQGVDRDEGKGEGKGAGGDGEGERKARKEREAVEVEEEEPEILHLWNVFVRIVTNFSYRLITRQ